MNEYGCGNQDGYDSEYSCSTIYGIIGTSVAAAIAFTAAAVYGTKKAAACTKENDAYDEQMARVAVAHVAPPPTSPDWPPELVAACEQERALLVERAGSTTGIAKRLRGDMVCGPVAAPLPKQPARKRYKGRAADGVGAGMLVGPISLGLGAAIFAGNQ
jgi:hypothetical protein